MPRRNGLLSKNGRAVVLATISALILTTSQSPLMAAPASRSLHGIAASAAPNDVTDVSSRRRHRHYRGGGGAAGAAMMGLAFGAIAGAIAAQQRRDYYENYGYYGPGYDPGPGYYYAPRYYRPYNGPYYGHRHFY